MNDDTYLEDMMRYEIFEDRDIFNGRNERFAGASLDDLGMSEDDKGLLEAYAPQLFNTSDRQYVKSQMQGLAVKVFEYRSAQSDKRWETKNITSRYPKFQSNKAKADKIKSFQRHIKNIHDLMGGTAVGTQKGNELKKLLEDAYNNPENYFTQNRKWTPSKDPIYKYLTSLKLRDKSQIILNFMQEI